MADSPTTKGKRPGALQTVDRALMALLAFHERSSWGVTELAQHLGIDKSMAQRLLATLAHRQFVLADPETRRYSLGPALTVLARAAERDGGLGHLAQPLLAELVKQVGESAILSVPHGALTRCAAAVDGNGPIRYTTIVGETMPGYGGAAAHAIYAYYPAEEVRRLFGTGPYSRHSEETIADLDALLRCHSDVRATGISVSTGEYDPAVSCVAAPGFLNGQIVASIAVIGPRERFADKFEKCRNAVADAGARLTELLQGDRD
ncbi:MAG: IclR family transcriptional regulator [Haloechinothrix sp.]